MGGALRLTLFSKSAILRRPTEVAMTSTKLLFLALLLTTAWAVPGRAQDAGTPPGQGQMPAAEQAIMEKYMKAGTPGPEHQKLAKLAGRWKMQTSAWMAP